MVKTLQKYEIAQEIKDKIKEYTRDFKEKTAFSEIAQKELVYYTIFCSCGDENWLTEPALKHWHRDHAQDSERLENIRKRT